MTAAVIGRGAMGAGRARARADQSWTAIVGRSEFVGQHPHIHVLEHPHRLPLDLRQHQHLNIAAQRNQVHAIDLNASTGALPEAEVNAQLVGIGRYVQ